MPGRITCDSITKDTAQHANTIFIGPGDDIWPQFLTDCLATCFMPGKPMEGLLLFSLELIQSPPAHPPVAPALTMKRKRSEGSAVGSLGLSNINR